jgi:GT2 family glycosyltransferase
LNPPFTAGDFGFQDLYLPEKLFEKQIRSSWCGACVVLSKDYLREVGGFDEDFFLYYEDIDLSLRGIKKGFTTIFYPKLLCIHGHSKSTSKNVKNRSYNIWRSRSLFVTKTYGLRFAIPLVLKLIKEILKPNINRSRLIHIRNNLLPEARATIRGMLRLR